jgi:predicted amidophosphoribosyltransferase
LPPALFPHACLRCGEEGQVLCPACFTKQNASLRGVFACPGCGQPSPLGLRCGRRRCSGDPLDGLVSVAAYADPVLRGLLRLYKYHNVAEARAACLRLIGSFAAGRLPLLDSLAVEAVAPIPMHPWREALRGFNQASELAGPIAELLGQAPRTELLARRWSWRRQAELDSLEQRRRSAQRAVRCVAAPPPAVLLVDDVFTSGATMRSAATALRSAGAREVWGLTLLRG